MTPLFLLLLTGCVDSDDSEELSPAAIAMLDAHDVVREPLGLVALEWSAAVATSAQGWADALAADGCAFEHEDQSVYGENLWWSSFDPSPAEVVEAWAAEVEHYDYETNTCADEQICGHYTQIVWADSALLGCGKATCGDGSVLWACRYDPPGNWIGQKPY
jgi:pathogenesis-related protein 1